MPIVLALKGCALLLLMIWETAVTMPFSALAKILALFCNPIVFAGVIGNVIAMLPWPINQLDHGTESFGHALVLVLGLILLSGMTRSGEIGK